MSAHKPWAVSQPRASPSVGGSAAVEPCPWRSESSYAEGSQKDQVAGHVLRWHRDAGLQSIPAQDYISSLERQVASLRRQVHPLGGTGRSLSQRCHSCLVGQAHWQEAALKWPSGKGQGLCPPEQSPGMLVIVWQVSSAACRRPGLNRRAHKQHNPQLLRVWRACRRGCAPQPLCPVQVARDLYVHARMNPILDLVQGLEASHLTALTGTADDDTYEAVNSVVHSVMAASARPAGLPAVLPCGPLPAARLPHA